MASKRFRPKSLSTKCTTLTRAMLEQEAATGQLAWFGRILSETKHDAVGKARHYSHKQLVIDMVGSRIFNGLYETANPEIRPLFG